MGWERRAEAGGDLGIEEKGVVVVETPSIITSIRAACIEWLKMMNAKYAVNRGLYFPHKQKRSLPIINADLRTKRIARKPCSRYYRYSNIGSEKQSRNTPQVGSWVA